MPRFFLFDANSTSSEASSISPSQSTTTMSDSSYQSSDTQGSSSHFWQISIEGEELSHDKCPCRLWRSFQRPFSSNKLESSSNVTVHLNCSMMELIERRLTGKDGTCKMEGNTIDGVHFTDHTPLRNWELRLVTDYHES